MIGIKGIFILVTLIVLFGGAIYDMTTTGVRCALGAAGKGNYTCDELGKVTGSTFVFPDRNIESGTDSILTLREYAAGHPDVLEDLQGVISTDERNYKNQILLGLAGMIVLHAALIWFWLKVTPSSLIHVDSKMAAVLLGFLSYIVIYLMFTGFAEGNVQMPYGGIFRLIGNPDVLTSVVDYTSALPGTLTTSDILDGGTTT